MSQTITETLADYIVNTTYDQFPKSAIEIAKLAIIDSIGCTVAGSKTDIGIAVIDYANSLGGRTESPLLGTELKTSSTNAAFVNAEMANALDLDDTYPFASHIGSTVVQPAIAVGCAQHSTGKDFLTAIIIGYEVTARIGPIITQPNFKSPKTTGHGFHVFGSTAVAAKLFELNAIQTAHALGTAGAAAPVSSDEKVCLNPLNEEWGAPMVKNNYGTISELSIRAALLAKRGYTGPIDIFEGDTGFPVMLGSHSYGINDLKQITADLGPSDPRITNLQFKPYSCCRHCHSPIDATLQIQREHQINPKEIEQIIVKTFASKARAPLTDVAPKTMQSAVMSIPYSVAAALHGVQPGLEWLSAATRERQDLLELAQKVKLQPDSNADTLRKQGHYTMGTVQIISKGKTYEQQVLFPKGSAENPMTSEEITNKFLNLTSPIIPTSHEILKFIDDLEVILNLDALSNIIMPR